MPLHICEMAVHTTDQPDCVVDIDSAVVEVHVSVGSVHAEEVMLHADAVLAGFTRTRIATEPRSRAAVSTLESTGNIEERRKILRIDDLHIENLPKQKAPQPPE